MTFNLDALNKIAKEMYTHQVITQFGMDGKSALIDLLDSLRSLYRECPPDVLKCQLVVVNPIDFDETSVLLDKIACQSQMASLRHVSENIKTGETTDTMIVCLFQDQTFSVLRTKSNVDQVSLAKSAIVYHYQNKAEQIFAGNFSTFITNPSPLLASIFANPTYSSLDAALVEYGFYAKESTCKILQSIWEDGLLGPRLIFVNKPESICRDSLTQSLQIALSASASVKAEHNTDETKPVDIKIDWHGARASALIEIKWLGRATAKSSSVDTTYTDYSESRARDGAKQLADYLDREKTSYPTFTPTGYLVIFDARRKGIKGKDDKLKSTSALHFRNEDIKYNPEYHKSREDFVKPVRFFLEPRASHFY